MKTKLIFGIVVGLILVSSFYPLSSFSELEVTTSSSTITKPVDPEKIIDYSGTYEKSKTDFIKPSSEVILKNSTSWNYATADTIEAYMEYELNTKKIIEQSQTHKTTPIVLDGNIYHMKLQPNILKSPDAWTRIILENGTSVEIEPLDIKTYKGTIMDLENASSIRLTIHEDWVSGFVKTGDETFRIAQMKDNSNNYLQKYMIYKDTDTEITMYSDGDLLIDPQSSLSSFDFGKYSIPSFFEPVYAVPSLNTKIILDCDKEFDELDTTHWTVRQMATLSDISAPFDDLDIGFELMGQSCDLTNFYLVGDNSNDLINDLKNRWNTIQDQRHLVHLFTGKVLTDVNRLGLAWPSFPAIDDPLNEGYSLVQHAPDSIPPYTASDADKQRLMAHEIGHNFGAAHSEQGLCEDQPGDPCSVFYNTIMCTNDPTQSGFCELLWDFQFVFSDGSISSNQNSGETINDNAVLYLADQFPIDCLNRPGVGDWIITKDCTLKSSYSAPSDVLVENSSTLIIPNNIVLFVDFSSDKLFIEGGSKVLIESGGKITSP